MTYCTVFKIYVKRTQQAIKSEGQKYILTENSKALTVIDVQKSNTGVYQCMSENSEGVLLKEAILNVIDPLRTNISTYDIATNIAYDNITTTGDTLTTTVKQTESQTVIYYIVVPLVVVVLIIICISIYLYRRKKGQYRVNEENNANQHGQEMDLEQTPLQDG
eukprot:XP_011446010.1 PREDICTED: uncharacterized protein LOC105341278 [Crassostrea gigas]